MVSTAIAVFPYTSFYPSGKQPPRESTATINAYMDTVKDLVGDDDVRWKTITKEKFDPSKAQGEFANDGITERTTTTFYYDDRVPAKKTKVK